MGTIQAGTDESGQYESSPDLHSCLPTLYRRSGTPETQKRGEDRRTHTSARADMPHAHTHTDLGEAGAGQQKPRKVLSVFAHVAIAVVIAVAPGSAVRAGRTFASTPARPAAPVSACATDVAILGRERGTNPLLLVVEVLVLLVLLRGRRCLVHQRRGSTEAHGALEVSGAGRERELRRRVQSEGVEAGVKVRAHRVEVVGGHEDEAVSGVGFMPHARRCVFFGRVLS